MKSQEYLEKLKELVIEHLMEIHQPDDKDDPEEVAIHQRYIDEGTALLAKATTVGGVLRALCASSFDVYQGMSLLLDAADVEYDLDGAPSPSDYDT